ncbi:MAG: hypothetical protein EPN22_00820 [Nitrospirae bacterium]|nr:MAG: hypothetical protein EPN22_00820 [Nitrospirota bacterium]
MKKILIIISIASLLVFPKMGQSQDAQGYRLLFGDIESNLSEEDKKYIYSQLEFTESKTAQGLLYGGEVAAPRVEVVDLNNDKVDEIFVTYGTWLTCGHAGACLSLFVKNSKGKYELIFDLPSIGYERLKTTNKGYPDLILAGPGFCHAVLRWNGMKYLHFKNLPDIEGGCDAIKKTTN